MELMRRSFNHLLQVSFILNVSIDGCAGSFMLEGACSMLRGWPFDLIVLILVLLMCSVDFVPLKAADSVVSVCVSEDVSDRVTVEASLGLLGLYFGFGFNPNVLLYECLTNCVEAEILAC